MCYESGYSRRDSIVRAVPIAGTARTQYQESRTTQEHGKGVVELGSLGFPKCVSLIPAGRIAEHKRLLTIANQDSATENVGNCKEIAGSLDEQAKTLRVDSLKTA